MKLTSACQTIADPKPEQCQSSLGLNILPNSASMTLKELFKKKSWLSVREDLYHWYPDEEPNDHDYEAVFSKLQVMDGTNSDLKIVLRTVTDDTFSEEPYVDVSGKKWESKDGNGTGRYESYAIEFKPWEEWLGMEIDEISLREFTETEILSHCLFEMTFVGFDQKQIQKRYEEMKDLTEEIKAITKGEKEGKLIPWEKIKRELGI